MERKEIEERFRAIVMNTLNVEESELKDGARFQKDLYADSLDSVEIVIETEKEFGISIPDEEAERVVTYGDALDLITRIIEEQ